MAELTPMMQQYMNTKNEYKDCILFYRLGDFYEMFFDDAITASKELEITLTGKNCGLDERAPMCGVPHHSVDGYLNRLVSKGYKVAICEQMEDPALAKGIVNQLFGGGEALLPGGEKSLPDDSLTQGVNGGKPEVGPLGGFTEQFGELYFPDRAGKALPLGVFYRFAR